ncbi:MULTISPECIES: TraR/DksA family transcriptional regulator [unclassified Rhizobium]|uniref:TraR/DksA family transcriptional regulator n=1 Tax=unclassified Rhizobium TaxID=2613769 RepID=UPI001602B3AC|nr:MULTISPECIES: TraR/DksA C4-type zinc finger protein [unclassified Rhizobium]MBB1248423.1 TraR/DksA family transcriptional regulator [Rhizobium sp. G21]MCV3766643.1 TraR/DksA C4-type zinc finger protein [Rhizobium sp. TRM95796]
MLDVNAFAARLSARKTELEGRLRAIEDELDASAGADAEDHALEVEGDEVLEGVGQAGLEELRAVNAALDRIARGVFGLCAKCGEPISEARLRAVPQAALCEDCIH